MIVLHHIASRQKLFLLAVQCQHVPVDCYLWSLLCVCVCEIEERRGQKIIYWKQFETCSLVRVCLNVSIKFQLKLKSKMAWWCGTSWVKVELTAIAFNQKQLWYPAICDNQILRPLLRLVSLSSDSLFFFSIEIWVWFPIDLDVYLFGGIEFIDWYYLYVQHVLTCGKRYRSKYKAHHAILQTRCTTNQLDKSSACAHLCMHVCCARVCVPNPLQNLQDLSAKLACNEFDWFPTEATVSP